MKKLCICILSLFFILDTTYALELQISSDKDAKVEQATKEMYKKILFENAQKKRSELIRKKLEGFLSKPKIEETFDYSYRYRKKSIQKRALSCEISVASDILTRHMGEDITEDSLIDKIDKSAYDSLPRKIDGKTVWGDPNIGFVGYIDKLDNGTKASQWKMTGYGVLERPIAKLYEGFGLETKIITGKSHRLGFNEINHLSYLLDNLEKGHSVQLWGDYCTNPKYEDSNKKNHCASLNKPRKMNWYYKDKFHNLVKHQGLAGEHAFFLLGYVGNKKYPKEVIVWDSRSGKHSYDIREWMRKWKAMQYRSVIIYDEKVTD